MIITSTPSTIDISGLSPNKTYSILKVNITGIGFNVSEDLITITTSAGSTFDIPNPVKIPYSSVTSPVTSDITELKDWLLSELGLTSFPGDFDYLTITYNADDKPSVVNYYEGGVYDTVAATYTPTDATTLKNTTYINYTVTKKVASVYYKKY